MVKKLLSVSALRGAASRTRRLIAGLLLLALAGAVGCRSVSQYVSPRVEGRVLDAHSSQPIKDVLVRRVDAHEDLKVTDPAKGGQLMQQEPGARTSADGRFRLDSIRDVAVFRHLSWYSVTLSFEHPDYVRIKATYDLSEYTNSGQGEPLVRTRDVLLVPKSE